MDKEKVQEQIEHYEKDIGMIQQKLLQFNTALQRTIGAKEALLNLLKGDEDETKVESTDIH